MKIFLVLFVLLYFSLSSDNHNIINSTTGVETLNWLAGSWITNDEKKEVEEVWLSPKGNLMPGINRTYHKSGKTEFEFLRIAETDSGTYYIASPGGKSPTYFKMISSENKKAIFENKSHDFPQKIIYQQKEDILYARVEGIINGSEKFLEWNFRAVK